MKKSLGLTPDWRMQMKKWKRILFLVITISLAGCKGHVGATNNKNSHNPANSSSVDLEKSREKLTAETDVEKYPKIFVSSESKTFQSEDGKQNLLYLEAERASVNRKAYPKLADGLEQWFDIQYDKLQKQGESYADEAWEMNKAFDSSQNQPMSYFIDQYVRQMRADSKVISLEILYSDYQGGTHGEKRISGLTFDTKTGKEIKQSDFITDWKKFENSAYTYIVRQIEDNYGDSLYPEYKVRIWKEMKKLSWILTDYGLQAVYSENEIAPYETGYIRVDIPYSMLADCANTNYFPEKQAPAIWKLNECCSYQMEFAGSQKAVEFKVQNGKTDAWLKSAELVIDGKSTILYDEKVPMGYYNAECFAVRNKEGEQYFIVELMGEIDSGLTELELYKEENGKLVITDTLKSSLDENTLCADDLECMTTIHVLGSYEVRKSYQISKYDKLVTEESRYRIVNDFNSGFKKKLIISKEFMAVVAGKKTMLKQNEIIYPIAVDDNKFYFLAESGAEGYLRYEQEKNHMQTVNGVNATKLFEGIQYDN